MATKAQIDAAAAILAEALDLQGSRFNGRIVPDWDALKRSFSGGLAQFEALGLDTTDARVLLNGPRADLIAAGAALRALSNEIVAMAPNDRPPATLGKFPNQLDHPYSGLDYSGMCCSPAGVLYQFGGGHVASVMGDVRSNDGTGWKSEYPPIPWQRMRVADLDADKFWHTPGFTVQPVAAHTYTGVIWSHAVGRMLKMPGNNGGSPRSYAEPEMAGLMLGGSVGHYDPATKTWEVGAKNDGIPAYLAFCEDPVSLNILGIDQGHYVVYDPRTKKYVRNEQPVNANLTYAGALAYWPDTDTFYCFAPPPAPGGPVVSAIRVDRANHYAATVSPTVFRRAANVNEGVYPQYLYDPVNKVIVGCLDGDMIYGYRPSTGWLKHPAPGCGTVNEYHFAYDPKNRRFLVINRNKDTLAFVWNEALAVPCNLVVAAATSTGRVAALGNAGGSNQTNFGPADWIDPATLPEPVPWRVYADAENKLFAPSQNGAIPARWKKLTPWGTPPHLYGGLPRLTNGVFDRAIPEAGDDILEGALPVLLKSKPTDGPRGKCVVSPYVTWLGHTRIKEDGTLGSPRSPLYIGIRIDGMVEFLMNDAVIDALKIPGTKGPLDLSFNPPDRKIFYVADPFNGRILKVDRHPAFTKPDDPNLEDYSKWVVTSYATALGIVTSCRVMPDGTMFACAYERNALLKIVNGVASKLLDVRQPFYVDYQSDGKLMLITGETKIHRIDPAAPNLSVQMMPPQYVGPGSINNNFWQLSVDRNGTIGPKDATYAISTHALQNTGIFRIIGNAVEANAWLPWGAGNLALGVTNHCIDATGHYPWVVAVHPDQALLLTQGYDAYLPSLFAPVQPRDPADEFDYTLAGWGYQVLRRGSGLDMPYGSVPSFDCQWDSYGASLLGISFDYVAQMSYADAAKFLQQGGFGVFPRKLAAYDLLAALYFVYRNSQRFLIEGKPLIDRLRAFVGPVTQPSGTLFPVDLEKDGWIDVIGAAGKLAVAVSGKYGPRKPVPDPGLKVRVMADEGTARAREVGVFGLTGTFDKLPGTHAYRALPVSGATITYWSRASVL